VVGAKVSDYQLTLKTADKPVVPSAVDTKTLFFWMNVQFGKLEGHSSGKLLAAEKQEPQLPEAEKGPKSI